MTFQEALEKNKEIAKGLKMVDGKLTYTPENEKIMRDFLLNILGDAGYMPLKLLVSVFWKIKE